MAKQLSDTHDLPLTVASERDYSCDFLSLFYASRRLHLLMNVIFVTPCTVVCRAIDPHVCTQNRLAIE